MIQGTVYCIENKINNKKYIGLTKTKLSYRIQAHFHEAEMNRINSKLYRAIRKYGKDNFIYYIIDTAETLEELGEKEKFYINKFDTIKTGYNCKTGGFIGIKYSEEIRKKMRDIHLNRSEEWKRNLSLSHIGCKQTKAEKYHKSEASKLRRSSDNTIKAAIEANKNRIWTEESKEKIRKKLKNNKKLTIEDVQEIRLYFKFKLLSLKQLGKIYNRSVPCIREIIYNISWKNLEVKSDVGNENSEYPD